MNVDLKTHKYRRQGTTTVMTDVNHYVTIKAPNSETRYYLQKGKCFEGLDNALKEIPEWLKKKMETMNPKVLEDCGFGQGGIVARTQGKSDKDRRKQLLKEGLISQEEYDRMDGPVTLEVEQEDIQEDPKEVEDDKSRPALMKECKDKGIPVSVSDTKDSLMEKLKAA